MNKRKILINGYEAETVMTTSTTEVFYKCKDGLWRAIFMHDEEAAIANPNMDFSFIASSYQYQEIK